MTFASFTLLIAVCCISSCAATDLSNELPFDPARFRSHFEEQNTCSQYVERLVLPVAESLSDKLTVREMRQWIQTHPEEQFSELILGVQRLSESFGPIDPRVEANQIKVTSMIWHEIGKRPGFAQSSCGADVREAVMESLHTGLGGKAAPVNDELKSNGVSGEWEQKWTLITALMAGRLATEFK